MLRLAIRRFYKNVDVILFWECEHHGPFLVAFSYASLVIKIHIMPFHEYSNIYMHEFLLPILSQPITSINKGDMRGKVSHHR